VPTIIFGQQLAYGMSVGPMFSTLYNPHNEFELNYKSKNGYTIRLDLFWNISKNIGIRSGLALETKGAVYHNKNPNPGVTYLEYIPTGNNAISYYSPFPKYAGQIYQDNLDYLELPLLLQFSFGNDLKIMPFVGPSFGWLAQYSNNYDPSLLDAITGIQENYLYRFNCSLLTGIGFGIPLKQNLHFVFEGMASYGLTNIVRNKEVKVKNAALMATGGVRFVI
jgi:hypothetical protein